MTSLYLATLVHTPVLGQIEIRPNTLMAVDQYGKIIGMATYEVDSGMSPQQFFTQKYPTIPSAQFHNLSGPCKFLFPGFIDTHIHASQYPNVGIGSELPLLDWLKNYTFELENKFVGDKQNDFQFSSHVYRKVIEKTLSNGTTCACYFTTIDTDTTKMFADLLMEKGQRGFVGKVCMDCNPTYPEYQETYEECMQGNKAVISHCQKIHQDPSFPPNFTLEPIITPRFAPSCSRELMASLGDLANTQNLPIQTHMSENLEEIRLVQQTFPEHETYAQVYDAHKLLTHKTIVAHAIHLKPQERLLLKQRQCSISHCPPSNTFISSGEAPVHQYLYQDEINVGLGTDLSGGYEQSMLGVVKASILVSHHLAIKRQQRSEDETRLKENTFKGVENRLEFGGVKNTSKEDVENRLEFEGLKNTSKCEGVKNTSKCEGVKKAQESAGQISVGDALYMSTMGGARACGMDAQVGTFAVGKSFDAQLVDLESHGSNVDVFEFQRPQVGHADYERMMLQLLQKWVFSGDDRNCTMVWCNGRLVVEK